MRFQFKQTIRTIMVLFDIVILSGAFYFLWISLYNSDIPNPFFRNGNYLLTIVYALIVTVTVILMKGHQVGQNRITEILLSHAIALGLCNTIMFLLASLLSYEFVDFVGFIWLTVIQMIIVTFWACIANRVYYQIYPPHDMLLVYDDEINHAIKKKLNRIVDKYRILKEINVSEGREAIEAAMEPFDSIVLSVNSTELRQWMINLCYQKAKRLYVVPSITNILVNGATDIRVVDTPMLFLRNQGLTNEKRLYKRLLDIVGSFCGILVLSPVFLVTALAIWAYDRKNVFYTQERLTIDGKVFKVLKFRSMIVDAERNGAQLATVDDDRITPVGKIIRKLRIDEIPQLFNVLKGDMSLVGPRPERPEIAAEYEKSMPEFAYRLKAKAGLTGYAQVYGKYNTTAYDKLLMDLIYIENYSFLLDLKLMILTLRVVMMPDKTEGIQQGERMAQTKKTTEE